MRFLPLLSLALLATVLTNCGLEDTNMKQLPIEQLVAKTLAGPEMVEVTASIIAWERAQIIGAVSDKKILLLPNSTSMNCLSRCRQASLPLKIT